MRQIIVASVITVVITGVYAALMAFSGGENVPEGYNP